MVSRKNANPVLRTSDSSTISTISSIKKVGGHPPRCASFGPASYLVESSQGLTAPLLLRCLPQQSESYKSPDYVSASFNDLDGFIVVYFLSDLHATFSQQLHDFRYLHDDTQPRRVGKVHWTILYIRVQIDVASVKPERAPRIRPRTMVPPPAIRAPIPTSAIELLQFPGPRFRVY